MTTRTLDNLSSGGTIYPKEVRTMAEKLKTIECDPNCGFMVRSHDEKEIIKIGKQHAKDFHNMTVSDEDARKMVKPA
jgi:predicted small metal-binding protein